MILHLRILMKASLRLLATGCILRATMAQGTVLNCAHQMARQVAHSWLQTSIQVVETTAESGCQVQNRALQDLRAHFSQTTNPAPAFS
jgi:hypothetical protein